MEKRKELIAYIERFNKVEGKELSELTEVQLVGYYCKYFELCMVDRLLDDIQRRRVPYVLGMKIKYLLGTLSYGGITQT